MYGCEIVHLLRSRVLVHGDIQAVLFAPSSPLSARAAVSYVANSHLDYISEKVITGERWQWHPEVAVYDIDDFLQEEESADVRRRLGELAKRLHNGEYFTAQIFYEELATFGSHEWTFGRVVNSDIIWAWRAVVKLDQLLTGMSAPEGA